MAYSAGFHPHPKISYVGAAPTGVGSEAEYLEIALADERDPEDVRAAIDAVLPDGLDIVAAVDAGQCGAGSLPERINASLWRLEFTEAAGLAESVAALMAEDSVLVDRLTKDGTRSLDARAPIVAATVTAGHGAAGGGEAADQTRAILELVVRQVTPTVRPDDVLTALQSVAGFAPSQAPRATRLAQGPIDDAGSVGDPLSPTVVTRLSQDQTPIGTR
ncbi:MAG: hypothetical protein QOK10_1885 [Pseudonocardiales bacterium]|jgi:radical SAM-linked protein|nr:hypothetical protein [Pseudonocardiales bacterium]